MDWSLCFGEDKTNVLVVGATQKDTVFYSGLLETPNFDNDKKRTAGTWPFRQAGAYAFHRGTRYAAIITPKELFLVEYYIIGKFEDTVELGCKFAVVPTHSRKPDITANFAIWAIGMYGLHDHHRHLDYLENITGLNVWYIKSDQSVQTYTNARSGRVLTDPAGLPEGATFELEDPVKLARRPHELDELQPLKKRRRSMR